MMNIRLVYALWLPPLATDQKHVSYKILCLLNLNIPTLHSFILVLNRVFEFHFSLISVHSCSSNHSRMRSKRLRTTEEPIALDNSSALGNSKKKRLGGQPGPKVRRSVLGPTSREEEKEKKKEDNSKCSQNQNSVQFSGKSLNDGTGSYLRLWISLI